MRGFHLCVAVLALAAACRSAPRDGAQSAHADSLSARADTPSVPAAAPGGASQPSSAAPTIARLVPDSLRLAPNTISEIAIRGAGFGTTATNTVRIGPIVLRDVRANTAGTELRVVVPERYTTNAEAPPRPLFPGDYAVTVETGGQTSNSKTLKVMP